MLNEDAAYQVKFATGCLYEVVASLEVKSLEVFVTKVVKVSLFHVDLRQTLLDDMSLIRSVPPIF